MQRSRILSTVTLAIATVALVGCAAAATPVPTAAPTAAPTAVPTAAAKATVEAKSVGSVGTVLVAANGLTLYLFGKDVKDSGKSTCSGTCLTNWPALTLAAGATAVAGTGVSGKLTTITRDDGVIQVAYNGMPLYFYIGDKAAGDATGAAIANWSVAKP